MPDFTLKNTHTHTYAQIILNFIKINVQDKVIRAKDRKSSYVYISYLHKSRWYHGL